MKSVCVYCGSSPGIQKIYAEKAKELGRILAEQKITLVYGGAKIGLMGHMAKALLEGGGKVIGVIPKKLVEKEVAYKDLPDLRIVNSMHERKALMAELSDGFIAMPGGFGTLDEFFEILTWAQLGYHKKPCGLLNIAGYFDSLLGFLHNTVKEGFVTSEEVEMILASDTPSALFEKMRDYKPLSPSDKARRALSQME